MEKQFGQANFILRFLAVLIFDFSDLKKKLNAQQ